MKIVEFFAGSRSIGKAAESMGYQVFSTDNKPYKGIDYVVDILKFDVTKVPFVPDVLWFSPPCTAFSVAGVSHHFVEKKGQLIPISPTAKLGIALLRKTIKIIKHFLAINPKLIFWIENPRGMMRRMKELEGLTMHTVSYCQYGDKRMKPTDIWTNSKKFKPKFCYNGAPCHVAAPRGSTTGTQGLKDAYNRSKIPKKLCRAVLLACR
jgi:site-specific DNA-cytosine methylase